MAATPNRASFEDTINGYFKTVYADKLLDIVPNEVVLLNRVPFDATNKLGKRYEQAVQLSHSGGFTYAGTSDMYALNKAQTGKVGTAQVDANEYLLREAITYKALSRSSTGGQAAFIDATKAIVKGMNTAYSRELEAQLMYGGSGIGVVASISGNAITLTLQSWADGIWAGHENSLLIQAYDTTGATLRVGGANTIASDGTAAMRVTGVDTSGRVITVDTASTGIVAGDLLFVGGAKGREMIGLHSICGNTGTLFNIDASTSGLWKGNTVDVASGTLSVATVLKGMSPVIGKGLSGVDVTLIIGVRSFNDLTTDVLQKRQVDSSYSTAKLEAGTRTITIYGQNGVIEVVPSVFCKEGFAYAVVLDDFRRIGSRDKSFTMPGEDGQFFKQVPDSAAFELRMYSDQALFCERPGRQILFKNITPLG